MGLSGPIPIEDAARRRRGVTAPSAQKDTRRTVAKVEKPNKPSWLTGHACTCWDHIVPLLYERGTIAREDRNAIIRYCMTYAKWREVAFEFMGEAVAVKGENNHVKKTPAFQVYRDLSAELSRLETEFGLTPRARARLAQVVKPSDDDPEDSDLD